MHVARLRLRNFRNYRRLDVEFGPGFHLLIGGNAQGKTNLLEAVYLLAALRSFRGAPAAQLVRHGAGGFLVGAEVVSARRDSARLYWSPAERRLTLNEEPVQRLVDYYGVLRAVVFCSEDIELIKGPGARRRRFMDLLCAQANPGFLVLRRRYAEAIKSRNALLRAPSPDRRALEGFTLQAARYGREIMQFRAELVPRISQAVRSAYCAFAPEAEQAELIYRPAAREDLTEAFRRNWERDLRLRTTTAGPHRDELLILLEGRPAADYASEGQKRSLAIALRMAQAEYLAEVHGAPPVLLLDDVVGELDARRRAGLLPLLERVRRARGQVFMTCAQEPPLPPASVRPRRWEVRAGTLRALPEGCAPGS